MGAASREVVVGLLEFFWIKVGVEVAGINASAAGTMAIRSAVVEMRTILLLFSCGLMCYFVRSNTVIIE